MGRGKKKKGRRGTVSVFLTIILVPCIIVTCAFTDISRVQLSKAGASSAADLALYSLMANYDVDLKDYYGLVASCQDIGQYYDKAATYFTGMMSAGGVSGEGSSLFTEYLHSLRTEGGVSDFLKVKFQEAAAVEPAEHAQMGENAALLEDGIVEFMKYRGIASILKKVMERFKHLDLSGASSNVDKDEQIVEKKQEYVEKESTLLRDALYSYLAVHKYEQAWQAGNPVKEKGYSGLAQDLSNLWQDLQKAAELAVTYYFADADRISQVAFPTYNSVNQYHYQKEQVGIRTRQDGNVIYCIDADKLEELLDGIDEAADTALEAADSIQTRFPQFTQGANPAVYLLEVQDLFAGGNECRTVSDQMKKLLKRYAKLKAALQCEPLPEDSGLPDDWKGQIQDACSKIKEVQKVFSNTGSSGYITSLRSYQACVDTHLSKIKNRSYEFASRFAGGNVTLQAFTAQIASRLPELRSELSELIGFLDVAATGGRIKVNGRDQMVVPLDDLVQQAIQFRNAREQWGATAGRYQTDYARQEQAAYRGEGIDDIERESEEMAMKIDGDAANELKQRITNIRNDMKGLLQALDNFTYGGQKVETVQSADTLISLTRTKMPARSSRLLEQNASDAAGYFRALIAPGTQEVYRAPALDNRKEGNNPDLTVHPPGLYDYFKKKFEGKDLDKIDEETQKSKQQEEERKEQAKEEAEKQQGVDNSILEGKGENITGGHGGQAVTIGSAISSIAQTVDNLIHGRAEELRDQIYVCEYIMDMFSYSSLYNEAKYKQEQNQSQNQNQSGDGVQTSDSKILSLTNRQICKENNKANLGEVEYILYGSPSIDTNLKKSYENIFLIRETLNLVSGFVLFYNGSNNETARLIEATAIATATATGGVVPVAATKCVLIGVLATTESAKDLERLKKGQPAVFYKTSDEQWECAVHNSGGGTGQNSPSGMYYSDYMYLFLIVGLTSNRYSDMLLRVGDLVEANMQKSGGSNAGFDLSKSVCYFHLKAILQVEPLMLALPIVRSYNGADTTGVLENLDWCTYQVDFYRGYS